MSAWVPGPPEQSYAGWYVWAKRNVSTSNASCHAAAQAATLAEADGGDPQAAARRTAFSRSGLGWENPADERTRDYAEMFDWVRRNLSGPAEEQVRAATAGLLALAAGAGVEAARGAAGAALSSAPPPFAPTGPEPAAQGAAPPAPPAWAMPTPAPIASPRPVPALPAPAAAGIPYSPDGRYFWDGTAWRDLAGQPAATGEYGSFLRRAAALIVDALLLNIALGILYVPIDLAVFPGVSARTPGFVNLTAVHLLLSVLVNWLYGSLLIASSTQGTLGQLALGLKVVDRFGNRVGFGRATGRYFATWVTGFTCGIGYLTMAWAKRRQTLHDILAGTLVVRRESTPGSLPAVAPRDNGGVAVAILYVAVVALTTLLAVVLLVALGSQVRSLFSNLAGATGT